MFYEETLAFKKGLPVYRSDEEAKLFGKRFLNRQCLTRFDPISLLS